MSSSSANLAPANPAVAVQDFMSDSGFMELSQKLKPLTWLIKVSYCIDLDDFETYCTGFALNVDKKAMGDSVKEDDLVIMTCAHSFPQSSHNITVRRLEEIGFEWEAEKLFMKKTSLDIALLVVKGADSGSNYAEFVDNGSIFSCQRLLQVGHSEDLVWSVFVGRSAYECVNNTEPLHGVTCGSYDSTSFHTTPNYRMMGHIWNKAFFNKNMEKDFPFEKHLNAHIPIIQCAGFLCRHGCSGGPVFNSHGKVVGMLVGDFDACQIAIHVTMLKDFVKEFVELRSTAQGSSDVEKKGKELLGGGLGTKVKKRKSYSRLWFWEQFAGEEADKFMRVDNLATQTKTIIGYNLKPTPWHDFPAKEFNNETKIARASKIIQCSYLSCGIKSLNDQIPFTRKIERCPRFFRWIYHDLEPWSKTGISHAQLMEVKKFASFRIVIINGKLYVDYYYYDCVQSRSMFTTIWGFLQLLKRFPGRIPDVDMMFDCMDQPIIEKNSSTTPLPIFRYCTTPNHYDIPFPDWSFWGWPEINIGPWKDEFESIKQGSQKQSKKNKYPYAYWRGNPDVVSEIRQELLMCNDTEQSENFVC